MSNIKIKSKNLNVYYGDKQALFDVNLDLNEKEVTALIGPSGCGKSTFIRCINRMNDVIDICKVTGNIEMDGININDKDPAVPSHTSERTDLLQSLADLFAPRPGCDPDR